MTTFKRLFIFLGIVFFSQLVHANNGGNRENKIPEGAIHGYVMDAITRKPITGVTVSVSSLKIQGAKEIQSDAAGHFQLAKLPAGDITLMFEKKGYKIFKRDVLAVKDGAVTKISVEVHPLTYDDGGNEMWHPLFKFLD